MINNVNNAFMLSCKVHKSNKTSKLRFEKWQMRPEFLCGYFFSSSFKIGDEHYYHDLTDVTSCSLVIGLRNCRETIYLHFQNGTNVFGLFRVPGSRPTSLKSALIHRSPKSYSEERVSKSLRNLGTYTAGYTA